jgi:hypothetical protein
MCFIFSFCSIHRSHRTSMEGTAQLDAPGLTSWQEHEIRFFNKLQINSGTHMATHWTDTCFGGGKTAGAWRWLHPLNASRLRSAAINIIPPRIFMATVGTTLHFFTFRHTQSLHWWHIYYHCQTLHTHYRYIHNAHTQQITNLCVRTTHCISLASFILMISNVVKKKNCNATGVTSQQAYVTDYTTISKASDCNSWIPNNCTKVSADYWYKLQ